MASHFRLLVLLLRRVTSAHKREQVSYIANRPQSELPCCCTRWTLTSRDFLFLIGPSATLAGRPSKCHSRGCRRSLRTTHCRRKPASGFRLQSGLDCCHVADGVTWMVAANRVCSPGLSVPGMLYEQVE